MTNYEVLRNNMTPKQQLLNKISHIVLDKKNLLERKKEIKRQMIQADEKHRILIEEFERLE